MYTISVRCPDYVAQYLKKEYHVVDGAVLLPQYCLAWAAIVNGTQVRPITHPPHTGNLRVGIMSGAVRFKNLDKQSWLGEKRLNYISKLLRWQFDIALLEYMEKQHYRHGWDYDEAMREFYRYYQLDGYISEEALQKKHTRWKQKRKEWRKQAKQLEI